MPSKPSAPAKKKDNRLSICLSDDLLAIEAVVMRRERYRSHSECYESFLRHWALSQQDHALTGGWASLSPEERTALDADLRKLVETGKGKKGSWLKAVIYDAIKELNGADAKSPTVDQVLQRLPEIVRRALKKS